MIKGNKSLVEDFNSYFLTPLSQNFIILKFDAKPITIGYMWCDQTKWVWTKKNTKPFLFTLHASISELCHAPTTSSKLSIWFHYFSDAQNNNIQRKLHTIVGSICKSILASSDSFCLIPTHWLPSYEEFVNFKNNIKQRNLNTIFANISKSISPTSDSFLLIMSHAKSAFDS